MPPQQIGRPRQHLTASGAVTDERQRKRADTAGLIAVLLLYLALGIAYSVIVPIFEAPDETSHFAYARYLAENARLPVQDAEHSGPFGQEGSQPPLYYGLVALLIRPVDMSNTAALLWNNPQNVMGNPAVPGNKNRFVHTDAEDFPYRGAALAVHLARLVSILMGAGTVWLTYRVARRALRSPPLPAAAKTGSSRPNQGEGDPGPLQEAALASAVRVRHAVPVPEAALASAAFVAFLPGFLFITAAVNNDAAVALFSTATLYSLLRLIQQPTDQSTDQPTTTRDRRAQYVAAAALGVALGLALLSKLSALLLLPFVVTALVVEGWRRGRLRHYATLTAIVLLLACLIAGWWFVRNIWLYGDPIASSVTGAIAAQRSFRLDTYLGGAWAEFRGLRWSFWGLFGWFSLLLPEPVYLVLDLLTIAALGGLALVGAQADRLVVPLRRLWGRGDAALSRPTGKADGETSPPLRSRTGRRGGTGGGEGHPLAILAIWLLIVFAGLVAWTTQTKGAHGRLLFPAIAAISTLLVGGWQAWLPLRFRRAIPAIVGVPMLLFAVWALVGVIRPAYARPALLDATAVPEQAVRPPVTFAASTDEHVRLLGASVDPTDAVPGATVTLTFYWQAVDPITRDALLNVRLFGHDMALLVNEDTYPGWGTYPPSLWPADQDHVVVDRYRFALPTDAAAPTLIRVDVGFVDRGTGHRWPALDAAGEPVSEPLAVTALRLHQRAGNVEPSIEPVARLADGILLVDYQVAAAGGVGAGPSDQPVPLREGHVESIQDALSVRPGDEIAVMLEWTSGARGVAQPTSDYTVFLHVVDEQGRIVTQVDGPPRGGDYPTSVWLPNERVPEQRSVALPADIDPGTYHLRAGMYDPATLDRLDATDDAGQPWPDDAIPLGPAIAVADPGYPGARRSHTLGLRLPANGFRGTACRAPPGEETHVRGLARRVAALRPLSWLLAHMLHRLDGVVIGLTGGRHSLTSLVTGLPVAMLTTIGARSGQPRTVPLLPLRDGANLFVIASNFGRPHHPAWYHNLKANPDVAVAVAGKSRGYTAREAAGEERERLWRHAVKRYPGYAAYKARAGDREIPVVVLEPRSGP